MALRYAFLWAEEVEDLGCVFTTASGDVDNAPHMPPNARVHKEHDRTIGFERRKGRLRLSYQLGNESVGITARLLPDHVEHVVMVFEDSTPAVFGGGGSDEQNARSGIVGYCMMTPRAICVCLSGL